MAKKNLVESPNSTNNKEVPSSLEEEFLGLSEKYKTKKEAYDKEVLEREARIKKLEEEILELESKELIQEENTEKIKNEIKTTEDTISETTIEKTTDQSPKTEPEKIIENDTPIEIQKEGQVIIDNQTEEIINELPIAEKQLLEETLQESTPLPFESPKVKKSLKAFIQNQIVKQFSGFAIPEKIKNITSKITKSILITTAVVSLWPNEVGGGDYTMPEIDSKNKITILKESTFENQVSKYSLSSEELETYNALPKSAQNIYLYALKNISEAYQIIDKPSATMYIIGKNKNIIKSFPVLLGQTLGETRNTADPDSDVAIGATTPAGKFKLGKIGLTDIIKSDSISYKGRVMALIGGDGILEHMTYLNEFERRKHALDTQTPDDNRMSWGCINISPENFDKYIKPNFTTGDHWVFITPDIIKSENTQYALNPETGKLEKSKESRTFVMNTTLEKGKDGIFLAKGGKTNLNKTKFTENYSKNNKNYF